MKDIINNNAYLYRNMQINFLRNCLAFDRVPFAFQFCFFFSLASFISAVDFDNCAIQETRISFAVSSILYIQGYCKVVFCDLNLF